LNVKNLHEVLSTLILWDKKKTLAGSANLLQKISEDYGE
jgi:hypothetical protein